jgi:hypothetical protein
METKTGFSNHKDAWQMVLGQLQPEMSRVDFKTWVVPIVPLGFNGNPDKYRLAVKNEYNKDIINSRLNARISRLLSGLYKRDVSVEVIVSNQFVEDDSVEPFSPSEQVVDNQEIKQSQNTNKKQNNHSNENSDIDEDLPASSKRKVMFQKAYGNERANIIQPDKGIYVTKYFMENWLPLLGHSALIVVMMVRKVCYWNLYTGEKRDIMDTEMGELAEQACISVRTLKTILKNDLIRRYFIRYTVRRVMTPNGIRTAGIHLQIRMDDPLTPEDQEKSGHYENGTWFYPEFEDESEDYDL